MSDNLTKVGIGVAIFKDGKVLLGKRKGSHGEGEYALPGGHLEYMESFEETALREIEEELGPHFVVRHLQVVSVINLTEYAPKHYIDIGMACDWVAGDPVVMEPDKVVEWEWFDFNNLPEPTFATVSRIIYASTESFSSSGEASAVVFDKGNN